MISVCSERTPPAPQEDILFTFLRSLIDNLNSQQPGLNLSVGGTVVRRVHHTLHPPSLPGRDIDSERWGSARQLWLRSVLLTGLSLSLSPHWDRQVCRWGWKFFAMNEVGNLLLLRVTELVFITKISLTLKKSPHSHYSVLILQSSLLCKKSESIWDSSRTPDRKYPGWQIARLLILISRVKIRLERHLIRVQLCDLKLGKYLSNNPLASSITFYLLLKVSSFSIDTLLELSSSNYFWYRTECISPT